MAQAHPAPLTVRLAGAVQAAEAVLLLAATVLAAVDTAAGKSYQAASGIALTVIGLLTVGLLLLVALGLARARQWTRTPALMTQLFTGIVGRSEEHTSELQSHVNLVCRLLLE